MAGQFGAGRQLTRQQQAGVAGQDESQGQKQPVPLRKKKLLPPSHGTKEEGSAA